MAVKNGDAGNQGRYYGIMMRLFDESVSLFHQLKGVAERVHQRGRLTAGKRGILRGIHQLGPQTVPRMARARNVTRQHIQAMVNELIKEGLAEPAYNPAHKRSKLVQLTQAGNRYLDEISRREKALLSSLDLGLEEEDLQRAADVLSRIREALGRMDPNSSPAHTDRHDE
jgi:DNA-binding MarR family transcriptional regulator